MWMFYTDNPCTVSEYMNMIFEIYNLYRMHIKMKNAVKLTHEALLVKYYYSSNFFIDV